MSYNNETLNEIWHRSRYIGNILFHLERVRKEEDQGAFALVPMLSILAEKSLKMCVADVNLDETVYDKPLQVVMKGALKANLITQEEYDELDRLRFIRNRFFHGLEYNDGIVIDGKFWAFDEADTHMRLYDDFSIRVVPIMLKLLK